MDSATTTLAQEFADSQWVVRAKLLAARDRHSDTEQSWTSYRIRVERSYKGHPRRELTFFTYRNSGGFYMDVPVAPPARSHDIGGDYLLFLNPNHWHRGEPAQIEGTVVVNYSCGVSKPWREVSMAEKVALASLAAQRDPSSDRRWRPPSPARGEGLK